MDMHLDLFGGGSVMTKVATAGFSGSGERRCYFTLLPPPSHAQDIERGASLVARRFGARYPIRAGRLHVSLNTVWRHPAEIPEDLIEDALDSGAAIRRRSFELSFDTVQTFAAAGRSRTGGRTHVPTVLTCSSGARDAVALYGDIRREMQRRGMTVGSSSFTPHLTLWYGPERVSDLSLKRPFRWRVQQFWLVQTTPGQRQPDYIAQWPLS